MTTYFICNFVFTHTKENVFLTGGAIIAAPIAWYYFVVPILMIAVR
jgi:hypothetical protein